MDVVWIPLSTASASAPFALVDTTIVNLTTTLGLNTPLLLTNPPTTLSVISEVDTPILMGIDWAMVWVRAVLRSLLMGLWVNGFRLMGHRKTAQIYRPLLLCVVQ